MIRLVAIVALAAAARYAVYLEAEKDYTSHGRPWWAP